MAVAVWALLGACGQENAPAPAAGMDAGADATADVGRDGAPPDLAPAAAMCGPDERSLPKGATMPWTATYPGGPDAAPPATCPRLDYSGHCRGNAKVRRQGAGITLTLADGTTLRWDDAAGVAPLGPPDLADGSTVWVDWGWWEWRAIGRTFTAGYQLQIRARQDGPPLWASAEGVGFGDVEETLVRDVFGVPAQAVDFCERRGGEGCAASVWSVTDHVLQTSPPITVHHGRRERVTTPVGTYDVLWTQTSDYPLPTAERCADRGEQPPAAIGFAALRVP
jgi:hypothetical protein